MPGRESPENDITMQVKNNILAPNVGWVKFNKLVRPPQPKKFKINIVGKNDFKEGILFINYYYNLAKVWGKYGGNVAGLAY